MKIGSISKFCIYSKYLCIFCCLLLPLHPQMNAASQCCRQNIKQTLMYSNDDRRCSASWFWQIYGLWAMRGVGRCRRRGEWELGLWILMSTGAGARCDFGNEQLASPMIAFTTCHWAACSVQLAATNLQQIATSMQHAACSLQPAVRYWQHEILLICYITITITVISIFIKCLHFHTFAINALRVRCTTRRT